MIKPLITAVSAYHSDEVWIINTLLIFDDSRMQTVLTRQFLTI